MSKSWLPAGLFACALVLSLPAKAQDTISTTDDQDYQPWGPGTIGDIAFGQSFTVPVDAPTLQSFTFTSLCAEPASNVADDNSIGYRTYIYSFDPGTGMATGSALYTSDVATVPGGTTTVDVPDAISPNMALTPGGRYIVIVSDAGLPDSRLAMGDMGVTATDEYMGGEMYSLDTNGYTTSFTTGAWQAVGDGTVLDAAFIANFASVPEPNSTALIFLGLGLLAARQIVRRYTLKPAPIRRK